MGHFGPQALVPSPHFAVPKWVSGDQPLLPGDFPRTAGKKAQEPDHLQRAEHCHLLRNSFLSLLYYNHKEPIKMIFLLEV